MELQHVVGAFEIVDGAEVKISEGIKCKRSPTGVMVYIGSGPMKELEIEFRSGVSEEVEFDAAKPCLRRNGQIRKEAAPNHCCNVCGIKIKPWPKNREYGWEATYAPHPNEGFMEAAGVIKTNIVDDQPLLVLWHATTRQKPLSGYATLVGEGKLVGYARTECGFDVLATGTPGTKLIVHWEGRGYRYAAIVGKLAELSRKELVL